MKKIRAIFEAATLMSGIAFVLGVGGMVYYAFWPFMEHLEDSIKNFELFSFEGVWLITAGSFLAMIAFAISWVRMDAVITKKAAKK